MDKQRQIEILEHDNDAFTALVRKAVRQAIEAHYRAGNAITIWRDDRMITVPPDDIPALLLESYGYDVQAEAPAERAEPPIPARNR